jgi:hypothetical protein
VITALDASVLLDIFLPDDRFGPMSWDAITMASEKGRIIVSDIVYAELVPAFGDRARLQQAIEGINAEHSSIDSDIAWEAGIRWMRYRRAGGPRTRILADFLIGAHALASADVFLTRDRGFYDTYFPELSRATPSG